jgi:hypothetical protein
VDIGWMRMRLRKSFYELHGVLMSIRNMEDLTTISRGIIVIRSQFG